MSKLYDYWDWIKEVALWHERRNADRSRSKVYRENNLTSQYKKGEVQMSHSDKSRNCDDERTCYEINACDRTVRRSFEVSVPFTVTPYAVPGRPEINCAGNVVVKPCRIRCRNEDDSFDFTVSQVINIDLPVEFGAEVCYDRTCVDDNSRCINSHDRRNDDD